MAEVKDLDIDLIKTDVDQIQIRLELDPERVEILCEKYKEKGSSAFPPIIVYHDSDDVLWLADGHYRLEAVRTALRPKDPRIIHAEAREGSKHDAAIFAAGANGAHGTQLSKEELRRGVERLLRDSVWGKRSARRIALYVGASNGYVSRIRKELQTENASASVYGTQMPDTATVLVQRGDTEFPMKADNINSGRSKSKTETTTPESASSEVPHDEPITAEDEQSTADDNQEVVDDVTPPDVNPLPHEPASDSGDERNADDNHVAATTKGYDDLVTAWYEATFEERMSFLKVVITHKQQERHAEVAPAAQKALEAVRSQMAQSGEELHSAAIS
jgi:hypothetical protein